MTPFRFGSVLHLLAMLLVIAFLAPAHPGSAQSNEVYELIDLINGLRASKGLEPYIVDAGLMAMAQQHSEYQASIHTSTHEHSDGSWPPDLGVGENVAEGDIGYLTPRVAVYEVWAGWGHMVTMVGNTSGWMGVGVADDGKRTYYTLEVRPPYMPGVSTGPRATGTGDTGTLPGTAAAPLTPIPLATLAAATPLADGTIVHVVGYGHTLWTIAQAYGVQIEQIRAWNNMAADANDIYAGQKLLVRPASLVTLSPTDATAEVTAPTPTLTAESTLTPSPLENTATAANTAEIVDDIEAAAKDRPGESKMLTPLIAGGSILVGFALLVMVGRNKRRN